MINLSSYAAFQYLTNEGIEEMFMGFTDWKKGCFNVIDEETFMKFIDWEDINVLETIAESKGQRCIILSYPTDLNAEEATAIVEMVHDKVQSVPFGDMLPFLIKM